MLLRKVWGWNSKFKGSDKRNSTGTSISIKNKDGEAEKRRMGSFDRIPDEILWIIMKKLGPKETAKLCLVCRSWRHIVSSDNTLWLHFFKSNCSNFDWDSIFFSETLLTSGYPLLQFSSPCIVYPNLNDSAPPLSLFNIYGLRAMVPGSLLVDGGSGYSKFGWSKYQRPSGRSATFPTRNLLKHQEDN